VFTFTDIFNDFCIRRDTVGQGFTALYENLLESQVAAVGLRLRFRRGHVRSRAEPGAPRPANLAQWPRGVRTRLHRCTYLVPQGSLAVRP
jgi:hypothetical protein